MGNSRKWPPHVQRAQQHDAPQSPSAPPASEISTASVNSARRIRFRLDPSASRRATSRERSAARAANRLPRLAHAANRINPARSINPVRKARTAPPIIAATPGRASPNVIWLHLWDTLLDLRPIEFRSAMACAGVTPGFTCPMHIDPATSGKSGNSLHRCPGSQSAQRNPEKE